MPRVSIVITMPASRYVVSRLPSLGASWISNLILIMSDDQAPGMMRALPNVRVTSARAGPRSTMRSRPIRSVARRAPRVNGDYAHNHGTLGNNRLSGGGYQALIDPGQVWRHGCRPTAMRPASPANG